MMAEVTLFPALGPGLDPNFTSCDARKCPNLRNARSKCLLLTQNRCQSLHPLQLIIHLLGRLLRIYISIHPLIPPSKHYRRTLPLRFLGSSFALPSRFRTYRFERQIREVRGYVMEAFARGYRGAADGVGAKCVGGPSDEAG